MLSELLLQEWQIKSDWTKSHQTDVQTGATKKSMWLYKKKHAHTDISDQGLRAF